jgi:SAM-dependent methyltransferase
MSLVPSRDRFLALLADSVAGASFVKLTLGKPRGTDATLQNIFVRPVALKTGPHLTFVWRHTTRDITKNLPPAEALAQISALLGGDFLDAHLFTATQTAQLETQPDGTARLKIRITAVPPAGSPHVGGVPPPRDPSASHDHPKHHLIPATAPWLRALGVTNDRGQPREGMADKFRQIQKFAELLQHHLAETFPPALSSPAPALSTPNPSLSSQLSALNPSSAPLRVLDAGSGKGYLTFAVAALLGDRAQVTGIEARPELVALCNRVAQETALQNLTFTPGQIRPPAIENQNSKHENPLDVLIALHACDTATDDALAQGIAAGARLLVVSPCCQKEIRAQLTPPDILADALRHGIFQERQAEFVTDALRAQLLEWAGYKTKVFEFISTEHTAKNLLIVAQRIAPCGQPDDARATRLRAFAAFYGVRHQRLAEQLGLPLT